MADKIFQKRDAIFKVGVCLVVFFSAVIGFFNITVLYWFGIPIFGLLIGLFLIWIGQESVKIKIILTFIPIPIITVFCFIFFKLLPSAEPETFLIPQNFRGQFEIVFNETCGQTIDYEKGRRIYRIPVNGVLILNAQQNFGVIDREAYLIDETGKQTKLPEFHWHKFTEEKGDWHWIFSSPQLSKTLVGFINEPANINYLIFTVSDYESLEKESKEIREERRKSSQNRIGFLLKECRQNH